MDKPKSIEGWVAYINWQWNKGSHDFKVTEVPVIPTGKWGFFPNTKDLWRRNEILEEETGGTAFYYKPEIGSTFLNHIHPYNDEWVYFFKGSATIITPTKTYHIKKSESILIKKDTWHLFIFGDEERPLISVFYPEKMEKGWTGTFRANK
jgi:quercetin dioxygenase-like cupin family protein